eukprot:CAMPEP_0170094692 /NCGR_PEP_ID=MMETSP0019_2-20121128/27436_1 /TAXON_ID=98059 /ORGANISM="Dinobryon sp., Strain UTEXLB2267" /LENGTH=196 /DNA_ID=CAMNT_0010316129 /DNA_START=383 /DNA_END=969 /DNA_ORIENTATION=+
MGVFATRSPHRPNPIGVTLAMIDRVDKKTRTVYLKACDLVDGTPVLDIKPYVPAYDTVPSFQVADWIADTINTRNTVTVNPACLETVRSIQHKLLQYKNEPEEYMKALMETLAAEVRSKFQTNKRMQESAAGQPVEVVFDETVVKYLWMDDRIFHITDIELAALNETKRAEEERIRQALQESESEQNSDRIDINNG